MKKFASMAMALVMALSMATVPAMAADISAAGSSAEVPVQVTTTGTATFKVTLPTALPVSVDANGKVTVADDVKITNGSAGAVEVSNMTIAGANEWSIVDYDGTDYGSYPVGSQILGMDILGNQTTGADAIDFDGVTFVNDNGEAFMWAGVGDDDFVAAHNTIGLDYDAKVVAQSAEMSADTVANVTLTVAWYQG